MITRLDEFILHHSEFQFAVAAEAKQSPGPPSLN
jgi:hypothetical protein